MSKMLLNKYKNTKIVQFLKNQLNKNTKTKTCCDPSCFLSTDEYEQSYVKIRAKLWSLSCPTSVYYHPGEFFFLIGPDLFSPYLP